MDEPKSLGKYETGSRTAMPIFKNFIVNTITKKDALPFKVPEGITMMVVNSRTGKKSNVKSSKTIYESYKDKNLNQLEASDNYNSFLLSSFGKKQKRIVKFY